MRIYLVLLILIFGCKAKDELITTCVEDGIIPDIEVDISDALKRSTEDAKSQFFPAFASYNIDHAIGNDALNRKNYSDSTILESDKQQELQVMYFSEIARKYKIDSACLMSIFYEKTHRELKAMGVE